ncbi:DUF5131 family protein [Methylosinus sp. LW4]|uniref:DUF5131 family protein n=1 Tax=Methylosinus sp. LW4 TaxID=136993 RepID=UPI0003A525C4|nr:DUF5131 family protein [Methylosinus sp. LW4]
MTKIEWAHAGLGRGATWNPIRARNLVSGRDERGWHCEKVSPACKNCYAERWNQRPGIGGTGLTYKPAHRGDVEHYLDEKTLREPLHWKTPRGIFVGSMTDMFGAWVKDDWLDKILAIAALSPQHIFIFLTKRPEGMRDYFSSLDLRRVAKIIYEIAPGAPIHLRLPLPNVWLGVTVEDDPRANERIPELLATPAAVRIVSYEPALGAVLWKRWLPTRRLAKRPDGTPFLAPSFYMTKCEYCGWVGSSELCGSDSFGDDSDVFCPSCHRSIRGDELPGLDQIISGGETGPDARPTHIDWERPLRDQCAAAGVAYFRKQIGEWKAVCEMSEEEIDACYHPAPESAPDATRRAKVRSIVMHRDGTVFDNPIAPGAFEGGKGAMTMFRVGRRRAGHLLDGKEHHEFPRGQR